jgi:hypothetical protein
MEPVYFGSDSWKNHSSYDNRYSDDHVYNRVAYDSQFEREYEEEPPKKKPKRFFANWDDDFIGGPF